jgi:hypothetical protein
VGAAGERGKKNALALPINSMHQPADETKRPTVGHFIGVLEEPDALGRAVETAFFKHVYSMAHAILPARQARGF